MAQQENLHARKVVDRFKEMLGDDCQDRLSEQHFDELTLLIESAIDAAVFDKMERTIEEVEAMAKKLRSDAEFFSR